MAGLLNHPTSRRGVRPHGETEDSAFLIMEFIEGVRRWKWMLKGALAPQQIVRVMEDVLADSRTAASRGHPFVDIKLNIMILADGRAEDHGFRHCPDRNKQHHPDRRRSSARRPTCRPSSSWWNRSIFDRHLFHWRRALSDAHRSPSLRACRRLRTRCCTRSRRGHRKSPSASPAFDDVVRRAMARSRDQRYGSAQVFRRHTRGGRSGGPEDTATLRGWSR